MKKIKFYKTCGCCEIRLKDNEGFWCEDCEKYKTEIKLYKCTKCTKKHMRTEELDWMYKGLCRKCFYEEFDNYKQTKKVLDELEIFDKNYKKKYGEKKRKPNR